MTQNTTLDATTEIHYSPNSSAALPSFEDVIRDWADLVAPLSPLERRAAILQKAAVMEGLEDEPLTCCERAVEQARQRLDDRRGRGQTYAELAAKKAADSAPAPRTICIYSLPELAVMEPEQVDWVWRPYVGAGDVASCEGPPKSGKSTFVRKLSAHVVTGRPFLGEPVKQGPVLYCTEERGGTTREGFERAGALDLADLHVLFRHEARGMDWAETVEQIDAHCRRLSIVLVVIDTLSKWAGLKGEEEQAAGFAMEAVGQLQYLAASGTAVVVVRHERKSGGATGEAGRGSSAFAGDFDTITSIRKVTGEKTQRRLGAEGRHDATPDDVVIDLVDGEYVSLGDPRALRHQEQERAVVDLLPASRSEQVTIEDVRDRMEDKASRVTVRSLLLRLVDEGVVKRVHGEVPGHPRSDGFWLRGDDD
jgi:AAA domain